MRKIYLKGLTELRAIAALMVVFHHIELYKTREGFASLFDTGLRDFISNLGKNGVYIFFVLSGFLISYLLLIEKERFGKINVKKFYIRRILRIWPLYYIIVLICFLILPFIADWIPALSQESYYFGLIKKLQDAPWTPLLLFLFFLPNLAVYLASPVAGASQAWSVGVEEQFYLIWPHLFNRFNNRKTFIAVLILICLIPVIPEILTQFDSDLAVKSAILINVFPIYYMAFGGIAAFMVYQPSNWVKSLLKNHFLYALNTALFIAFLFIKVPWFIHGSIVALQLLYITQESFRFNLRNSFLENLGDVSYGIYMYHPLVMFFSFAICRSFFTENSVLFNLGIYLLIVFGTIIISKLSYRYVEQWFITLKKKKYTLIKSGK